MSDYLVEHYFDERMVNRQRLLWTVATRRQLERWEPYVAKGVRLGFSNRQLDGMEIWLAAIEHHFALIAARHVIRALALPPPSAVEVDEKFRSELIEGRDLHEHWEDNLPVFNITPRRMEPPRRSGRDFAARNPRRGPYSWLGWSNQEGANLLPNVAAPALHQLLDAVQAEVLASDATLGRFVPPRAPSPWLFENGEWWPKPEAEP
jgi:hypothetical protein